MPSSESDGAFETSGGEVHVAPDVREGLSRSERIILACLREAEAEIPGRDVPTPMIYGRVVEHLDISQKDFMMILSRLTGHGGMR